MSWWLNRLAILGTYLRVSLFGEAGNAGLAYIALSLFVYLLALQEQASQRRPGFLSTSDVIRR